MEMWRQEKKRDNLSILLIGLEIAVAAIVILAFLGFLWQNTDIKNVDKWLQAVFIGLFVLLIIAVANYIVSKRW